jgi:hypothetical protein
LGKKFISAFSERILPEIAKAYFSSIYLSKNAGSMSNSWLPREYPDNPIELL